MSKAIREIVITAVLILVLAALLINNLKGRFPKKPGKAQAPVEVAKAGLSPSSTTSVDKKITKTQKERAESLAWGRDPFQYIEEKAEKGYRTEALVLKGVSIGKDKPSFAFINNEIVKVGDAIGGYEVVQILKDKVLLRRGGEVFYLTLTE